MTKIWVYDSWILFVIGNLDLGFVFIYYAQYKKTHTSKFKECISSVPSNLGQFYLWFSSPKIKGDWRDWD